MTDRIWPWYMSAAAVREYMRIAGIEDDTDAEGGGPNWDRAERELGDICLIVRKADTPPTTSGGEIYRTGRIEIGRRKTKIELTIMPSTEPGKKPALVRVRDKGLPPKRAAK